MVPKNQKTNGNKLHSKSSWWQPHREKITSHESKHIILTVQPLVWYIYSLWAKGNLTLHSIVLFFLIMSIFTLGYSQLSTFPPCSWISHSCPTGLSLSSVTRRVHPAELRMGRATWRAQINVGRGLPWGRSGGEPACQRRGHGFEPWCGRIPHAAERLSPWATTTEPVLRNKRGRDSERPAHRDEEWPPLAATREKPSRRNEHPTQPKNK